MKMFAHDRTNGIFAGKMSFKDLKWPYNFLAALTCSTKNDIVLKLIEPGPIDWEYDEAHMKSLRKVMDETLTDREKRIIYLYYEQEGGTLQKA